LRQWLSPVQRAQFAEKGYFEVVGGDTGKRYRIYAGAATNVCKVDENGHLTLGLCFLPMGELPIGDVILSQKIALESSESRALAVARRFVPDGTFRRGRPPGSPRARQTLRWRFPDWRCWRPRARDAVPLHDHLVDIRSDRLQQDVVRRNSCGRI
jgi:hypothetical protein